jgi:hypothetical protein
MEKEKNIIADKTYKFALRTVNAYLFLSKEIIEYKMKTVSVFNIDLFEYS